VQNWESVVGTVRMTKPMRTCHSYEQRKYVFTALKVVPEGNGPFVKHGCRGEDNFKKGLVRLLLRQTTGGLL
jgi:hypothetical protein